MVQWIMGLNALNTLTKTLMMIGRKKQENHFQVEKQNSFSEFLKKEIDKEKADQIVSLYDSNHDGKISVRESGLTVQEFQQWDMNRDGYITAQEIQMLWSHLGPFKNT